MNLNKHTISAYIQKLHDSEYTPSTMEKKLINVEKFLTWALQNGHIEQSAYEQVKEEIDKNKNPKLQTLNSSQISNQKSQIPKFNLGIRQYIGLGLMFLLISFLGFGIYSRFIKNTRSPFAYSSIPTGPGVTAGSLRFISFQGRLTDTLGNPINAPIDITYKFYTVPTGGTELSGTTRVCTANADQDGIFSNLIGNDNGPSCATGIPNTIFTDNPIIYLGVKVGSEVNEMTPRQQIANVGYAMNAETLQGLPPGRDASNIPYINSDGDLLIAASTPGIRSTHGSANFTVSSAKAMVIQSAGGSDITLSATDGGALRFVTSNGTPFERLTVLNTGNVGISNTNPKATLDITGDASASGNITIGNGSVIRPAYGPLSLAYKSGVNSWTTGMTLQDSTGNVGIGTTSPLSLLHVAGTDPTVRVEDAGNPPYFIGATNGYGIQGVNRHPVTGTYVDATKYGTSIDQFVSTTNAYLDFATSQSAGGTPVTHMRITKDGNVGIGTTDPGAYKLRVNGTIAPLTTDQDLGDASYRWDLYANTINADSTVTLTGIGSGTGTALCRDGSNNIVTCAGAGATLQSAYDTGNTITTTTGRNISITLAELATDTTFNIYQAGTGGAAAFRVDDDTGLGTDTTPFLIDQSGNVGIGSTSPTTYKLEVVGDIYSSANIRAATDMYIAGTALSANSTSTSGASKIGLYDDTMTYITANTNVQNAIKLLDTAIANGSGGVTGSGTDNYIPRWNGTTALENSIVYDSGSNIGIGTTTPLAKLDVVGDASMSGNITIGNGSVIRPAYGPLSLAYKSGLNAWTTGLTLQDTTGYVGIGTTSPLSKFVVSGAANFGDAADGIYINNGSGYGEIVGVDINKSSWNDINFRTGSTTTMTVATTNNVGIGTTIPGAKLDVNVTSNFDGIRVGTGTQAPGVKWLTNNASGRNWMISTNKEALGNLDVSVAASDGSAGDPTTNSSVFSIKKDGNVGINSTSPGYKLDVVGTGRFTSTLNTTGINNSTSDITMNNTSVTGANLFQIGDGGATEGLSWADSTWVVDTSPLDRSNATGNLNLYGTANNIALWRPSLWVYNATNYTTATAQSTGGLDFTSTGTGHITFNPGGNVGIGTTTPGQKFTVGSDTFQVNSSGNLVKINNVAYSWPGSQGASNTVLTNNGSGTLTWTDPGTLTVRWNTIDDPNGIQTLSMAGNNTNWNWTTGVYTSNWATGTGTSNLFNLTTDASANGTGSLLNIQTGTSSTVSPLRVRAGATEAIFVKNDGNVGVGTTSPGAKLDVQATSRSTYPFRVLDSDGTIASQLYIGSTGAGSFELMDASHNVAIYLSPTAGSYFNSGNVGIGTTNPSSYNLQVVGTGGFSTSVNSPTFQGQGAAVTFGNASYLTTITGLSTGAGLTIVPTSWTATPTISGLITATSGLTSNGTVTVQNNSNLTQTGTGTFGTGTGAVSLNGDTTIAANKNLSMASGTGVYSQTFTGAGTTASTITASSLTSGKGLNVTSAGAAFTGVLADISLTGNNAANTGTVWKVSSTGPTNTGTVAMITNLGAGVSFRVNDETGDADTTPFIIDTVGNVGIGTTTADTSLHIVKASSGAIKIVDTTQAAGRVLTSDANGVGTWTDPGTLTVRWNTIDDPNGNQALTMGGYTSTWTWNAATGAGVNLFNLTDTASNTGTGYLMNVTTAANSALHPFRVATNNGTEALMVDTTGYVGVGTTSPTAKLHVVGTGFFTGDVSVASQSAIASQPNNFNVAPNSSFEVNNNTANTVDNWTVGGVNGDGTYLITRSFEDSTNGAYSIKTVTTGTTSYANFNSTRIPVSPSTSYTQSVDVKGVCATGFYSRIQWYDQWGNYLGIGDAYSNAATTANWVTYSGNITSPTNAYSAVMQFWNINCASTRYYDNVALRQTSFPGGINFAVNSGNVGIGTTNPSSYNLQTVGTGGFSTSVNSPTFQGQGAAVTFGNASYLTTITGLSTGAGLTIVPTSWTATPTISGLITATLGLTSNGTVTVQNNSNLTQTGTGTFGTGSGAVSLNGDTTIAANKNLSMASGTGVYSQTFTGTTTTGASITASSLTSGKGLNVTSAGAAFTGVLADISLTGNNAANTGTVWKVSSTGPTNTGTVAMITNLGAGVSFRVNDETGDADTTPFIIDTVGNVGIGTTDPSQAKLTVSGDIATLAQGDLRLYDTDNSHYSGFHANGTTTQNSVYTLPAAFPGSNGYIISSDTSGNLSWTDPAGLGVRWNTIINPTGNQGLSMGNNLTTWTWDSLTTLTGLSASSTSLTSGTLFSLATNGTGALTGQKLLSLSSSGANATAAQTTYGLYTTNTHTGTTSTNVGGYFSASGGTTANYAAIFDLGNVGIGTTTPSTKLNVVSSAASIATFTGTGGSTLNFTDWGSGVNIDDRTSGRSIFIGRDMTGGGVVNIGDSDVVTGLVIPLSGHANSGNIGVGTTTPSQKLDVVGGVKISTGYLYSDNNFGFITSASGAQSGSFKGLLLGGSYDTTASTGEIRTSANQGLTLNARGTGTVTLSTADTAQVTVINNGNVGIGTITPGGKLDIESTQTSGTISLIGAPSAVTLAGALTGASIDMQTNYIPGTNNRTGLSIAGITATAGTENAIDIGANWDNYLNTSTIDITGTGSITGATGIASSGTITFSGANTVTSGALYSSSGTLYSEAQLAITRGGTNSTATPTAGAVAYGTGSAYAFNLAGVAGQVLTSAGAGTPVWTDPGSLVVRWNTIDDPNGNQSLSMGAYTSTWTYNAATGAGVNLFNLTDTTNNTGTGYLANFATAAGSALSPLRVAVQGSDAFTVSPTAVTSNLPTSFTAAGDVSIAYDLLFTNQTASYIKSLGPITLETGESFESNNLTLKTYNSGKVVLDSPGGVVLNQAQPWSLATSTTALNIQSGLLNLDTTNNRVGIGTTVPNAKLDVNGTINADGASALITFNDARGIGLNGTKLGFERGGSYFTGFDLLVGASSGLVVDTAGNVGIGTTNPSSYNLQTVGTGGFSTSVNSPTFQGQGAAVTFGNASYLTTITGLSTGAGLTIVPTSWTATPTISGLITATLGLTSNGTVTVQNNSNLTQTGTGTFGTGSGAVSLNGDTTIAANKNLSMASGTGVYSQTFTGTTTTGASITASSLTSGKGLNVTSAGAAFTGVLADISLTGNNAANTGTVWKVSSTGPTNTGTVAMITNLGAGVSFRVNDETGDADTTPFIIDTVGNVGIGTTDPSQAKLTVSGDIATLAQGDLRLYDTDNSHYSGFHANGTTTQNSVYTLPAAFPGSNGYIISSDTSGNLSWTDPAGLGVRWNTIINPTGNQGLSMGNNLTTWTWDSLTTLTGLSASSTSLTSGTLFSLATNGTGALTGQKLLSLSSSGANATAAQTTYGLYTTNTHTGTTSTNVGGYFSASGGTTANYAAIFDLGNVGVGTTGPIYPLHLYKAASETGILTSYGATNIYLSHGGWSIGAGKFGIGNGTTPTMVFDTVNGNVGIGTTTPGSKLDVQSADNVAATNIGSFYANNRTQAVGIGYQDVRQQAAGVQLNINAGTTGILYLGNTSTGGVNIAAGGGNVTFPGTGVWNSSGNVGINTTSPSQAKLTVSGDIATLAQGDLRLYDTDNSHYSGFQANGTTTGNSVYTLPAAYPGTSGFIVASDTSGNLSWTDPLGLGVRWNSIQSPNGAQSLAMAANTTNWGWDTFTTGTAFTASSTSLTSGTLFSLATNGTGALTGQKLLSLSSSGANATAAQTTYGLYTTNTHTGTTSTNVGGYFSASGGTTANYAAIFDLGNVGIGTTLPGQKLDVSTNGAWQVRLNATGTSGDDWYVGVTDAGFAAGAGKFLISPTSTSTDAKFVIDSGGNVGIGTTNPSSYNLQVTGTGYFSNTLTLGSTLVLPNSNTITGITGYTRHSAGISVGGAETYYINSSGTSNLNAGTFASTLAVNSTAANALDVAGGIYAGTADAFKVDTSGNISTSGTTGVTLSGNGAGITFSGTGPNQITTASGVNIALMPGGTGNVGIGTTSPTYKLHETASVNDYLQYIYNTNTGAAAGGLLIRSDGAGNLLSLNASGSDIVTISPAQSTFNNPTSFTSAGDVAIAYDINFTNPTASYIKSAAPLYIASGETFNSSDLNLKTYNSGDIVMDAGGATSATGTVKFYDSNVKSATVTTPIAFGASSTEVNSYRTAFGSTASILAALNQLALGSSGLWLDGGTYVYPNTTYATDVMIPSGKLGVGYSAVGASGVAAFNGNVGIGTTSPGAKLGFVAATTASGGIDFGGDTNLYRSAADQLQTDDYLLVNNALQTNSYIYTVRTGDVNAWVTRQTGDSANRFTINTTGTMAWADGSGAGTVNLYRNAAGVLRSSGTMIIDGNIGIGTTNPGVKLQISGGTYQPTLGNLQVNSTSGISYITIGNSDVANAHTYVGGASGIVTFGALTDANATTEGMRLTGTGLAIGTTSSGNKLDVNGAIAVGTYAGTALPAVAANGMGISGNVGIGTTNPLDKLTVSGASGVRIQNGTYDSNLVFGSNDSWKSGIRTYDNGDAEMRIWHAAALGQIVIATGYNGDEATTMPTDGLFIDQNKVGIGYVSPAAATGKLFVNGNVGIGTTVANAGLTVGSGGTNNSAQQVDSVYIKNNLEVDGTIYGSITASNALQVGQSGRPGYSCLDILRQVPGAVDGIYYISPDGTNTYQVYCDMTTNGGGWTFLGHVNSDSGGGSFFTAASGSYQTSRADNGAMYSLGLLDNYPDTEVMVTLDSADPITANAASKIVFYKYGITHAGFQTGPITCSGLAGPPYFQYKTTIAGSYVEGGTSNSCDASTWYSRTAGSADYLTLFHSSGLGNYWGGGMGGNSSWGHDGWWYFRETSTMGGSLAIGTKDPITAALVVMGGNVGIGTTSPGTYLDVLGANNVNIIRATNGTQTAGLGIDSAGTYWGTSLFQGGNKAFTVESNYGLLVGTGYQGNDAPANGAIIQGSVGIGTTNPGGKLQITGGDIIADTGVQVDFFDEVGDKAYWYSNTYGTGMESSTLTDWSASQFRWRTGGTSVSTGTEQMLLSATALTLAGNLDVNGTTNDIAGTLNLSGNTLASTGDLTIDPTGGGVKIGTGTPGTIDLAGDDLYVTADLEVDGTIYGNVSGTINPGFTTGSVIFQGATGLAQDNANFFWDDSSNELGIGTAAPSEKLDVAGTIRSNYEYTSLVTFTDGWAINDYQNAVQVTPGSAGASGLYEITIDSTRGGLAESSTYLSAVDHSNGNVWRETGTTNDNSYVGGSRCFTVDTNGNYGAVQFRVRALRASASCGATGNLTVNVKVRSIGRNTAWSTLAGGGTAGSVTGFQSMAGMSWNLYTGNPYTGAGNLAINAISNGNVGIGTTGPLQNLSVGDTTSDLIQSYGGFIGHPTANIGGTGDAAYFPEGIYSAQQNWLYGGIAMNNGALTAVGSIANNGAYTQSGTSANTFTGTSTFSNATYSALFTGGNVGIGTTTPGAKLQITGAAVGTASINIGDNSSYSTLHLVTLGRSSTGYGTIGDGYRTTAVGNAYNYDRADYATQIDFSNGAMNFKTSPIGVAGNAVTFTNRLTILNTGNIGIGSTSPTEGLDLAGTYPRLRIAQAAAPGTVTDKLYNVSGNLYWNGTNITAGGALPAGTNGQTLYNSSGTWTATSNLFHDGTNVGIGTTIPGARLQVSGTIDGLSADARGAIINPTLRTSSVNGLTHTGLLVIPTFNTTSSNVANAYGIKISPNHTGTYTTTNAYGLYVDTTTVTSGIVTNNYAAVFNGGNVGIGTTNPSSALLHVAGTGYYSGTLTLGSTLVLPNSNTITGITGYTRHSAGISVGGAETYYINSSGTSNLNAGTFASTLAVNSTAANALDVAGGIYAGTADAFKVDTSGNISTTGTTGLTLSGAGADITFSGTGPNQIITASGVNLALMPGGTGNVGIGSTVPVEKLDVAGNIALTSLTPNIYLSNSTFGTWRNSRINPFTSLAGRTVNYNPDFLTGVTTGYSVYNNNSALPNAEVSLSIVADTTAPNSSGNIMRVTFSAAEPEDNPSPGWGGFYLAVGKCASQAAANCYKEGNRYIWRIWAKIPSGRSITWASNLFGTGSSLNWITPVTGSDTWQEYSAIQTIGSGGTLSSTGFFYISGGADAAFTWDVAQVEMIGIDEPPAYARSPYLNIGYSTTYDPGNNYGRLSVGENAIISGNVGIGSTNPGIKLDVVGGIAQTMNNFHWFNTPADGAWRIGLSDNANRLSTGALVSTNRINVVWGTTATDGIVFGPNGQNSAMEINGSGQVYFRGTGNIGIGTTSPTLAKVRVSGNNTFVGKFGGLGVFGGEDAVNYGANAVLFGYNTNYLNSLGGTGSNAETFLTNAAYLSAANTDTFNRSNTQSAPLAILMDGFSNKVIDFNYAAAGTADSAITWSNRVRFDMANGNVGIGSTTPGERLDVNGNIKSTGYGIFPSGIVPATTGAPDGKIFSPSGTYVGATNWGINYNEGTPDFIEFNNGSGPTSKIALDDGSAYFALGGGNVGIGTTTLNSRVLMVSGDVGASRYFDSGASNTYYLDLANSGTSLATAGDIDINSGAGKLNVGTIDPPYTINGNKYATYISSMTGVKEETTGTVELTTKNTLENAYEKIIDLSSQPDGSDLWLFAKTSKLRENMDKMTVLLTPNDNTRVWYKTDKQNQRLYIYSSRATTISYRLTAPRFDSNRWLNTRSNSSTGFILDDPDNPITIDPQGNLEGAYATVVKTNPDPANTDFEIRLHTGELIEEITTYAKAFIASIKAGFIEVEMIVVNNSLRAKTIVAESLQVTTENITFAGKTINQVIDERIEAILNSKQFIALNTEKIISPIVETTDLSAKVITTEDLTASGSANIAKLQVNEITPQNGDLAVILGSEATPESNKGQLSRLIINGLDNMTVASIDSSGNATFSGTIAASEASISGTLAANQITSNQLTSNEASISGTLIAKEVKSENIDQLTTNNQQLSTDMNAIQQQLAALMNSPLPNIADQTNIATITDLTDQQFNNVAMEQLTVTGSSNLFNATVSNSLVAGSLFFQDNRIIALASELRLSALEQINMFDGAVVISKNGNITTTGEIIAQGGIRTNTIRPITPDDDISLKLNTKPQTLNSNQIQNSKFKILNSTDNEVASIDASGSAQFNSIAFNHVATPSALIADSGMRNEFNEVIPAIKTNAESAGSSILPANTQEVIIYNERVTKSSLVYLTPVGTNISGQLTVVKKENGYFSVSASSINTSAIEFNWLIIN